MATVSCGMALSQYPVFLVGYPRSGTTLLQALLATQGDIVTFPETHFFTTLYEDGGEIHDSINNDAANKLLNRITEKSGITFDANFLVGIQHSRTPESVPVKDLFEAIVIRLLPDNAESGCRWLEKTPDHGLYLEQILHFYPKAKFICIVRNPLHAIHSRTKYFTPNVSDPLALLSRHWINHIRAFETFDSHHPGRALLVRYEDLIRATPETIGKICEFLAIDFVMDRLEDYRQMAESIIQPFEYWKQDVKVGHIFNREDNTRSVFSLRETLKIQAIVLEKMRQYGYQPRHPLTQRIYDLLL